MVKTEELDSMVEWLLGNYAYGHLDEMPDAILTSVLSNSEVYSAFVFGLCHTSMTTSDSVEELITAHTKLTVDMAMKAQYRVRAWIVVERLRRMGKLKVNTDVLVKEMATAECLAISMPDGSPLKAQIVEVTLGKVMIVGEEINLCGA